jgi:monosaccharide ABC transporter substrate-binding protein, CUT2 family (TC 3.A.1.2.-)
MLSGLAGMHLLQGRLLHLTKITELKSKIFGIDVSNADLQMMQAENSPWVLTAAADAKLVGTLNVRLLAKENCRRRNTSNI